MSRRKIEDEAEARRFLLAIETEGWDIRTWARAHDVDGRSLHAWSINLARVGTIMLFARLSSRSCPARRPRRGHRTVKRPGAEWTQMSIIGVHSA